jgi:hypothetical protein
VIHILNLGTKEAEAGVSLSSQPAWSTEQVPGQPGIHRETLSREEKKKEKQNKTIVIIKINIKEDLYQWTHSMFKVTIALL